MPRNLPNLLTMLRILLIPVMVALFFLPFGWGRPASAWVFLFGALTDIFDGYLARRLHQTSAFGQFLDPVADKLQVVVALVILVDAHPHLYVTIPALVIVGREITISALREWMASLGKTSTVAVVGLGKLKTIIQMTALTMMLHEQDLLGLPIYVIGVACLFAATVLTLWSMTVYLRAAWPSLITGNPSTD